MAIAATQYIAARYPGADSARVTALLPLAEDRLDPTRIGDKYGEATGLLVLHWLTKEELAGGPGENGGNLVGQLKGEKEGDLSRSFGEGGGGSGDSSFYGFSDWNTTTYGKELTSLVQATCFGMGVA